MASLGKQNLEFLLKLKYKKESKTNILKIKEWTLTIPQ